VREAISLHINSQFIFGEPDVVSVESWLMYIPVQLIRARNKYSDVFRDYYVNVFTANIERQ
jgi:hypothetical protein